MLDLLGGGESEWVSGVWLLCGSEGVCGRLVGRILGCMEFVYFLGFFFVFRFGFVDVGSLGSVWCVGLGWWVDLGFG